MAPPLFILSGVPGAGKTTLARALLQTFARGYHLPLDELRGFVVAGRAEPLPDWTDETTRQFQLAFTAAADLAKLYHEAGFAVVIEQVIYPHDVRAHLELPLRGRPVQKLFLKPSLDVVLARNRDRQTKAFDTAQLEGPIRAMYDVLAREMASDPTWRVLDTSSQGVHETVGQILASLG